MVNEISVKNIEIRKLTPGAIFKLSQILESGEGWKQLMSVIPLECKEGNPPKYTVEHMRLIETAGICQKRPYSEILLEEWGTSGKCRPTLTVLLACLEKAQLYRAADFVAVDLLKQLPPERPESGPAAEVKWSDICVSQPTTDFTPSAPPRLMKLSTQQDTLQPQSANPPPRAASPQTRALSPETRGLSPEMRGLSPETRAVSPETRAVSPETRAVTPQTRAVTPQAPTALIEPDSDCEVVELKYSELEAATDGFAAERVLGGGAFGTVYLANLSHLGAVAVKRLHPTPAAVPADPMHQFQNEVQVLAHLSHNNLLPLLGYSRDGAALCLAYKFMKHGSLQDQLECKNHKAPLHWKTRLSIALGTARGLAHLHTALPKPLVHRDVKSANILLDDNFTAKLGDFGLVRLGSSGQHTSTVAMTTNVIGTSAYMAPEAHRGDVSVKMDIFSFGVVLLELVTGLPPYDEEREGLDLVTHIDDIDDKESLVDRKAGNWSQDVVTNLFQLADTCLLEKKKRPFVDTVIDTLESFCL